MHVYVDNINIKGEYTYFKLYTTGNSLIFGASKFLVMLQKLKLLQSQ